MLTAGPGGGAPSLAIGRIARAAGVAHFAALAVHHAVKAVGGAVGVAGGGAVAAARAATSAGLQARRAAQGVDVADGAATAGLRVEDVFIGVAHGAPVPVAVGALDNVWVAHWSRGYGMSS